MNAARARWIVLALIVLAAMWGVYRYRVRIEACAWHLRHGTHLVIGNYIVPVPANWYVENEGNGGQLLFRLDTDDHTPYRNLKWHSSILILPERPMNDQGLSRLVSLDEDFLKKQGVNPILERTFDVGNEAIHCMGGGRLPSPSNMPDIFDAAPISWQCKSTVGLDLVVIGTDSDIKQVWEIVSGIRKKQA